MLFKSLNVKTSSTSQMQDSSIRIISFNVNGMLNPVKRGKNSKLRREKNSD